MWRGSEYACDDEIVIKPADKVSAIAVWSKKDYLVESSRKLNNATVSQKCQSATLQKVREEIKYILRDILNHKETMDYIIMKETNLGRF